MNILYIVQYWPSLFEVYMYREVRWMRTRGHNVAVVSLDSAGPLGFRNESNRHIEEFEIPDLPVLQLKSSQLPISQMIEEIRSFARQQKSELIDAHFAREPAELAYCVHRMSGIPFAVRMRGGDVHTKLSPDLPAIVQYAAAVCPVSRFLADVLTGKRRLKKPADGIPVNVSPDKLRVLPYNLSAEYLSDAPVKQSDEVQIVGSIGRVVPLKRFEDIVRTVAELVGEFSGLRLLIIGGGPMKDDLVELAERVGIGDRLEITGFKSWREVMTLIDGLHIYVQASELEGFCLTPVEAGFRGVPLVLSRTGIQEECIEPGVNGFLFDSGDTKGLKNGLRSVLRAGAKGRREMGEASLRIVGDRFTEERVMPVIEAVFQAAMTGKALPSWRAFDQEATA